jgi:hypothetical protein
MEALNHLLKAQADVKQRQVTRQASGAGGPGNNNRNYDVSTLFDKELQRTQQSNYETQASAEQVKDPGADGLDKIKDLARRQDELLKRQEQLARDRQKMSEEEIKRELEKLMREQSELRQKAEELAREQASGSDAQKTQNSQNSQSGRGGQSAQTGKSGQSGQTGDRMRDVSEEMRNAANDLRRQDPAQASARGARVLQKLRDLEKQMQAARPDERRRAVGDMQLETRQLADAERQVASELGKAAQGEAGKDTMRRLAGDQERLAERVKKLQDGLKQQAAGAASGARGKDPGKDKDHAAQAAAADVAREIDRQRLAERLQKSADDLRAASGAGRESPQEMARSLDKLADKLGGGNGASGDSHKLSEQLAKAQALRERMNNTGREMQKLGQQSGKDAGQPSSQKTPGDTGRSGQGQSGGGAPGDTLARLREEYARQLKEMQDLMEQMRRDDPTQARGGSGFTFEGQGMTWSAPGTEAFKQDFAKWEELKRQATSALDRAEASLSKKLQEQESKDRLAAGVEDKAPPEYQKQVDRYFKALATKKK